MSFTVGEARKLPDTPGNEIPQSAEYVSAITSGKDGELGCGQSASVYNDGKNWVADAVAEPPADGCSSHDQRASLRGPRPVA